MQVTGVYRVKGVLLVGKVECNVKIGDRFVIVTENNAHKVVLHGIETFGKTYESLVAAGQEIVLYTRTPLGGDLTDVKPGAIVWRLLGV